VLGVRIPPGLPIFKGKAQSLWHGLIEFHGRFNFELLTVLGEKVGRLQRKKASSVKKKKAKVPGSLPAVKDASLKPVDGSIKEKKKKQVTKAITKTAAGKQKSNFITSSIQFLREVKFELKKVTWPTRKQTMGSTVVVIILVTIIAFFLGAVDIGLSSLVRLVLQ
jgi:preprotein translocase subunit SecE